MRCPARRFWGEKAEGLPRHYKETPARLWLWRVVTVHLRNGDYKHRRFCQVPLLLILLETYCMPPSLTACGSRAICREENTMLGEEPVRGIISVLLHWPSRSHQNSWRYGRKALLRRHIQRGEGALKAYRCFFSCNFLFVFFFIRLL